MRNILLFSFFIFSIPLKASVVYTSVTSPWILVDAGSTTGDTVSFDFNGDGTTDLNISLYTSLNILSGPPPGSITDMVVNYKKKNSVVTGSILSMSNAALPDGYNIDASTITSNVSNTDLVNIHTQIGTSTSIIKTGLWDLLPANVGYIGFSFKKNGNTHYGWIRFITDSPYFYIDGWAYETVHDQMITTSSSVVASTIATAEDLKVNLFPNPCSQLCQINSDKELSYKIYNAFGSIVLEGISMTSTNINLQGLESGIYQIELSDGQRHKHLRFIKQ
jgi:hypothetical protein